jgi:DNA mismatch repair protein MSH4
LADSRFKAISEKIKAVIHDDTRYQKGTLNMRTQKCFAIKPKINGLLDVARRTYTETVDDVSGLVVQLSEQHNLPLKSGYSSSRGFYIQLNAGPAGTTPEDLPGQFLKVSRQRNTLSFTTSDLIRLNGMCSFLWCGFSDCTGSLVLIDRIKESLSEIYLMTNV